MPTVTVVIHTFNSAKTLDLCLRSVSWADEIFVVDMGSIDTTLALAKKYGAKIFNVKSDLSYADPIRNEYLAKVKTDWTLILDSDEEVPPTLAAKFKELMSIEGVNGYAVPRKNLIFGRFISHTGYWPDYIVRFFRTGQATYPPQVHAQPLVDGKMEFLPPQEEFAFIHHHYATISDFVARMNTYTGLEVEKLTLAKKNFSPTLALKEFFAEWHRRFFQLEGYKDGSYGFTLSLLNATYQMLSYLKAWETQKSEEAISLDAVEMEVIDGCDATSYWVANEELKNKHPLIKQIGLKIKRKLHS